MGRPSMCVQVRGFEYMKHFRGIKPKQLRVLYTDADLTALYSCKQKGDPQTKEFKYKVGATDRGGGGQPSPPSPPPPTPPICLD